MDESDQFRTLFEGFELLVVTDIQRSKPLEQVRSSTVTATYPLEARLVPGRLYIFRKANQIANEKLATNVFPKRLSNIGATVTKAPKSHGDLIDVIVGGPLFVIEFEKSGHQGKMLNTVHVRENNGEYWEELVVVYD